MSARLRLFANQWQGVFADDFTLEQVRRRSYSLGVTLAAHSWSCLVSYDTRFMSALFAGDIARGLNAQGVPVSLTALPTPLPVLQHALDQRLFGCALAVSARNLPYWYNGLVLLGPLTPDLLSQPATGSDLAIPLAPGSFPPPSEPQAPPQPAPAAPDVRGAYLAILRDNIDVDLIRHASMTIFADSMNGTTAGYLPAVIGEEGQTRFIEINREAEPFFGRVPPLPVESGLNRLRKLVRESDSHIGLGISADGTALGVVDKNGELLDHVEVSLLLAAYLMRQYRQKGMVVVPRPANGATIAGGLSAWEEATGLRVEMTTNPALRINEISAQERPNLLLGCTNEGEMVLGRYGLYPDALLAGALMVEMVARNGGNLRPALTELRDILDKP